MANGVVENEICPVFTAQLLTNALAPVPDEVAEYRRLSADELRQHLDRDDDWLSLWARCNYPNSQSRYLSLRGVPPPPIPVAT
jgi:isopentenyldiphosphate isomerase